MTTAATEAKNHRLSLRDSVLDFYKTKTERDRILHQLRIATCSPSTHNRQNWRFKVNGTSLDVFIDRGEQLPKSDPTGRDDFISAGCLMENITIVAECYGVLGSVEYKVKETKGLSHIATVKYNNLMRSNGSIKDDTLLDAIIFRQNARGIFNKGSFDAKLIEKPKKDNGLGRIGIHVVQERGDIKSLALLTAQGLRLAYSDSGFRKEMAGFINSNFSKSNEGIHGYALTFSNLLSVIFPTMLRHIDLGKKVSGVNQVSVGSSSAIIVLTAQNDNPESWVRIGRLAQGYMLRLHTNNIKSSVFVASIEMGELYKKVKKILKTNDRPQFLFCVGEMKDFDGGYTRREKIETKII